MINHKRQYFLLCQSTQHVKNLFHDIVVKTVIEEWKSSNFHPWKLSLDCELQHAAAHRHTTLNSSASPSHSLYLWVCFALKPCICWLLETKWGGCLCIAIGPACHNYNYPFLWHRKAKQSVFSSFPAVSWFQELVILIIITVHVSVGVGACVHVG